MLIEVESEETHYSYDELADMCKEVVPELEEEFQTIDQGGDDDYYEFDLPDGVDSEEEAETLVNTILDKLLEKFAEYDEE
jgi:phosphoribosylformylglycinamidine (FGAM) synthase PurS component